MASGKQNAQSDLESKNREELEGMAKDMGLRHSHLSKDELIQTIRQHGKR